MFIRVTKQVNGLENNLCEGSLKKQDHLKLSRKLWHVVTGTENIFLEKDKEMQ